MSMTPNHVSWQKPCDEGHDLCEGAGLHIRGRDKNGCAQFQDGSWFTKDPNVCWEKHPGKPRGIGEADVTRAFIESGLHR